MKKLVIFILFLVFTFCIFAQTTPTEDVKTANFNNVKMLKSEQDEEVKVEIRKPDNASLMPRQDTDFENSEEMKMIEKLKKSNKMLY
jgi:hypothetical protein